MDNQAYYRIDDSDGCDIAITDAYLVVNCVGICVMTKPFTTYRRHGRHDYYLLYLYQGELDIFIDGQPQTIQAGHMVIFHPDCETRYTKRDENELVYYWAHFTGAGVPTVLEQCSLGRQDVYFAGIHQDIADMFRQMFQNFIYRDACYETAAGAQLTGILVQIRRSVNGLTAARRNLSAVKISKSLNYIHRHYSQMITVGQLAEIEHLSVSRYRVLFRQCIGVSPQTFIIDLRLRMAAELMSMSGLNLKQIAQMVGYDDQLYFSRLFKAKRGFAPKKYLDAAAQAEKSLERKISGRVG